MKAYSFKIEAVGQIRFLLEPKLELWLVNLLN